MTATPDPSAAGAADRLNAWWDAEVRRAVHPGGGEGALETDLAPVVTRLHARDDAPPPDPAFADRLWRELVAPAVAGARPDSDPARSAPAAPSLGLVRPTAGRPLLELIAAAVLLALLGGGLHRDGRFPGFAVGSPTVSAHENAASVGTGLVIPCFASPTPSSRATKISETHAAEVRSTPTSASKMRGGAIAIPCARSVP